MKRITALITVLLMLAASSAFAAVTPEVPAYLNGTSTTKTTVMYFTGFGLNATNAANTKAEAITFFNSTKGTGMAWNATGTNFPANVANFTGRLMFQNASNASIANSALLGLNATFNTSLGSINGLTSTVAKVANATNDQFNRTAYFIPAGGHTALFGLVNASLNSTSAQTSRKAYKYANSKDGMSFISMFVNGTFDGIASDSDVWDYYAYGVNRINGAPIAIIGQVKITADSGDGKASVKYAYYNGTRTYNTSDWITYNATGINTHNSLALTRDGGFSLLQNSTINVDENLIVGNVNTISATNDYNTLFVVMVKNAATLSTDDLKGHAFRQVFVGSGAAQNLGNATAGLMQFSLNSDLGVAGDAVFMDSTVGNGFNVALDGYTVALADTDQFGLTQSNMTIANTAATTIGAFYGKQTADKTFSVGFYEPISSTSRGYALAILVPTTASTGPIVAANAAYQNNSTLTLHGLDLNSTGYTKTQLRATWTDVAEDFTPLTDVKGFNATYTETQRGDVYYTFQYAFDGVGDQVKNLRLYKLFPNNAATVKTYSYASEPEMATDGAWWISTAVGDGYVNEESYLAPETTYYVNYVVKDNGDYDYKGSTAKQIGDPVVLGSVPASSSSSSGCVFNPAAGFGLEWLLLMLAPMVAIVRSRFK